MKIWVKKERSPRWHLASTEGVPFTEPEKNRTHAQTICGRILHNAVYEAHEAEPKTLCSVCDRMLTLKQT